MRHPREDPPALITDAPESLDDEYDRRRKRYAIMMTVRALCVIGAALTYRVSWILAIALVVGGAILPWCAVLLANDRPPKKAQRRRGHYRGGGGPAGKTLESRQKALPPTRPDQTVDGRPVDDAAAEDAAAEDAAAEEPMQATKPTKPTGATKPRSDGSTDDTAQG